MPSDARRPARATVPVRLFRLGEEPPETGDETTTAAERFELVAVLSARMHELRGGRAAQYDRASIPVLLRSMR
jgi:hypothetical protein